MEGKDRFLLAALGFSATSTVALAAVLLAFAVTGGFEAIDSGGDVAASVTLYGVSVSVERFGVADALCVESGDSAWLYTPREGGSIAFIVLRVESGDGSGVTITGASFTTGGGRLELAIPDAVFVGTGCSAPLVIEDAVPYSGGLMDVEGSQRVVLAFHVGKGFEREGSLLVGLAGKTGEYTVEFEFERCRVTGLKVYPARG